MAKGKATSKPASRSGNEPHGFWLWLVPRCGTTDTSFDSGSELIGSNGASPLKVPGPHCQVPPTLAISNPSPVASATATALTSAADADPGALDGKHGSRCVQEGTANTSSDKGLVFSEEAEQRDNFEGVPWQIRSYKAKSEGQVLSRDIFPAAPVTNASASSQTTGERNPGSVCCLFGHKLCPNVHLDTGFKTGLVKHTGLLPYVVPSSMCILITTRLHISQGPKYPAMFEKGEKVSQAASLRVQNLSGKDTSCKRSPVSCRHNTTCTTLPLCT